MRIIRGHRGPPLGFALVLIGVFLAATAWGAAPESLLARRIVNQGQDEGRLRVQDARIDAAARALARIAAAGTLEPSTTRHLLWNEGVWDFDFRPIVLSGNASETNMDLALRPQSGNEARWDTFGVGAFTEAGRTTVAAILVRRDVRWQKAENLGERPITVSEGLGQPRLYVTHPDGRVELRPTRPLGRGGWDVDDSAGNAAGAWLFEIVADGPTGPRILALWRRDQGAAVASAGADAAAALGGALGQRALTLDPQAARDQEATLWRLIQETRASRGLPTLVREPGLVEAARTHARDLARGEAFGHETSSGTVLDRLERHGVVAIRALENAAIAKDVHEAHLALLASPAHRFNLLDPGVDRAGVAVVLRREEDGRVRICLSEVFAVLRPEEGPGLRTALVEHVQKARITHGLHLLREREILDRIAASAVETILQGGGANLDEEQRRAVVDEVAFHFRNAKDVGVSFLVTADPAAVARVAHLRRPGFTEVGVAVRTSAEPLGDQPAGVLVVAMVFVAR